MTESAFVTEQVSDEYNSKGKHLWANRIRYGRFAVWLNLPQGFSEMTLVSLQHC